MAHKLIGRKSVIIITLAAFFMSSFYIALTVVKSNSVRVEAETTPIHKTTPDLQKSNPNKSNPNADEPPLKVLNPTLLGIIDAFTGSKIDSPRVEQTETNPKPILPPPDVTSAVITNGMVPVFYKLKTEQPVVFLTIDDGLVKDPAVTAFMSKHHLVATMFLNDSKISTDYGYFRALQATGNPIENHTISHRDLTKLTYAQQKYEICNNADNFEAAFGKRPTLFRPPYGAFNNTTRRAAADCGMTALIHWHAKANNSSMQYQEGDKLQPGDIVLMHFRKEVIADLAAFTEAAEKAHLQTVLLEDWIK